MAPGIEDRAVVARPLPPPNPWPAVNVRLVLAHCRSEGIPFEVAWPEALAYVRRKLRNEAFDERESWLRALNATRGAFEAAYQRTNAPRYPLTRDLIEPVLL